MLDGRKTNSGIFHMDVKSATSKKFKGGEGRMVLVTKIGENHIYQQQKRRPAPEKVRNVREELPTTGMLRSTKRSRKRGNLKEA